MDNSLQIQIPKKQPLKVSSRPVKFGDYQSDVMSVNFDPEGRLLAVAGYDGSLKIFNALTGKPHTQLAPPCGPEDEPVSHSCVRWRPTYVGGDLRPSTVLASILSNGLIQHWSMSTFKAMQNSEITRHRDARSSLSIIDYSCDGKRLCVAGEDRCVHVYDDSSCELVASMHSRGFKVPGHVNRVHALRCHPEDFNVVVSAGWDRSLKIYDIRDKAPVASIGGPECSGDCVDLYDDLIVTGSTRFKNVMQMYSLSQRKLIHTWDYNSHTKDVDSGYVLACRFSADGNFIIAGGAGKNEIRVFANNCDSTANYKLQMEIKDLPSAVYTIDVNPNPDQRQFVFGCGNGQVMGVNYDIDMNNVEFEPYQYSFNKVAYDIIAAEELAKKQKKRVSPLGEHNKQERFNV